MTKRPVANSMVLFLVLVLMLLSGCAAAIKYKFTDDLVTSDKYIADSAVVDVFQDVRVEQEKMGANRGKDGCLFTKDKDFKPDIPNQVTTALAEHLEKAKLFKKVVVKDISNDLENNASEMASLKSKGFDYAVTGNLEHFYGYVSGVGSCITAGALFGAIGVLVEGALNPKFIGGETSYSDVKLIDLGMGSVVWKGDIEYTFEDKKSYPEAQVAYSLKALKDANNKLVQVFKENAKK